MLARLRWLKAKERPPSRYPPCWRPMPRPGLTNPAPSHFDKAMPRDPYIREKFTREISHAREVARDYFTKYPKDRYETEVETWADIQSYNIEFTMKRLRDPIVE